LFQTVPIIGQPVAAVLRQVEGVVDVSFLLHFPYCSKHNAQLMFALANSHIQTIAFGLIDTVQSRASDLQSQANSLSGTLQVCINSYDGLSLTKAKRTLRFARREVAAAA
jgi:hypothetical protein